MSSSPPSSASSIPPSLLDHCHQHTNVTQIAPKKAFSGLYGAPTLFLTSLYSQTLLKSLMCSSPPFPFVLISLASNPTKLLYPPLVKVSSTSTVPNLAARPQPSSLTTQQHLRPLLISPLENPVCTRLREPHPHRLLLHGHLSGIFL